MRKRLAVGATVIGLLASMVVAGPASAATVVFAQRVVTETVLIGAWEHRGAYPQCARGEYGTGGGFFVSGTTDPTAYTVLVNGPYGNGWNAQLYLDPGFGKVKLTAYAVCLTKVKGDPSLDRRVVTAAATGPSGTTIAAYPKCKADEIATGGGYTVPSINPLSYTVYANEPLGASAWNVQIYSDYAPEVWAHVVCIRLPKDVPMNRRTVNASGTVLGQSSLTVTAKCEPGWEVVSGGGFTVASINPNGYTVWASRPTRPTAVPQGWEASVFNDAAPSSSLPMWAYAVCVKSVWD